MIITVIVAEWSTYGENIIEVRGISITRTE